MSKKEKNIFYSLDNILKCNCDYNIIIGERSNGKTTSVLRYILEDYVKSGYVNQGALIRRFEEDFKGRTGSQLFDAIVSLNWVHEITNGRFNSIRYFSGRRFLVKYDKENGEKIENDEKPFMYAFAITKQEHYKSSSFPNIKTVMFDEFITRDYYLPNEFVDFQNLLSTIIRLKEDVKIFMLGNTINKYCIYFNEMGLNRIKNMKKGDIDIYTYGDSNLRVGVEFSDFLAKKKGSNKYFAFDNPRLEMIKSGTWEIDIYPHLTKKYRPKDVVGRFYIEFDSEHLEGKIISLEGNAFLFIHPKTTPIEEKLYPVYSTKIKEDYNYSHNLLNARNNIEQVILKLFKEEKVFYSDNNTGELVRNYLGWCKTH